MANRIKIRGTTADVFDIGLNKGVLDFSNLTTQRSLIFPDSNGSAGFVLSTNGAGALSWVTPASSAFVPYFIPTGNNFTVPDYDQALFRMPITVDGSITVAGYLLEV